MRIGIFDSGLGGLTVAAAIISELPDAQLIYFGDTARVPYGPKSQKTIQKFAEQNTRFLISKNIDMLVIACNTASAYALSLLKSSFSIPIIDVIAPGVKSALGVSKDAIIGIIGTIGTIKSGAYQEALTRLKPRATIVVKPCPLFVPLVEEGFLNHPVTKLVAKEYLDVFKRAKIDTLVLACTHYPLLKPVISEVLGNQVLIVDSAIETAREVSLIANELGLSGKDNTEKGMHEFYLSDVDYSFSEIAIKALNLGELDMQYLNIEEY